ncbi:polysaccharide pyruvyl transferase family protein [Bacteroides zhangwenhongii]|uniref:polysaccharide pyruvyl transferase family protein n=1 Tax=Bacteroides zhangwenhongii TaxID=2650157 RepID=UPI003AACAAFA
MKIALYAHGGSKNHGCEALVRSIIKIIGEEHQYVVVSENVDEDKFYHLDTLADLKQATLPLPTGIGYLKYLIQMKLTHNEKLYYRSIYRDVFKIAKGCDIGLAIGGDNYCYKGYLERFSVMNEMFHKAGVPTVLFGCSIEPSMITDALLADLYSYKLITARESITYEALKKAGVENVVLYPDSAFRLPIVETVTLKDSIRRNTVGINVSPLIIEREGCNGMIMQNYEALIEHILSTSDMSVILIPHVVWTHNDDRKPLSLLFNKFKDTGRVYFQEDCNACELKSVISHCRFIVAARTHASIAAYSTGVPTLVVGYSVKAHGIAKDLFGTDANYVISVESLLEPFGLTNAFIWLQEHEQDIKMYYKGILTEYISRTYDLKKYIY